jgi:lipopolysaccharide biosynthesis regulator YciM
VDAALRAALLAALVRDLDRVEEMLGEAVRMDSRAVEPYLALGRLYRLRGEVGRAIRLHQNLLLRRDLSPEEETAALADLAADFQQGGFLRRAIASYEEVLSRDRQHPAALRALVQLLAQVREYPRAIRLGRRLAKLEGRGAAAQEADLLVEMAEAAEAEGRSDQARRAVRRALRRRGDSVRAWILLGALEAERGRSKAALAAWSRVPEIDRRSGPAVYPRIEATYAALDRSREFEDFLRRLLDGRPDDPGARLALARTLGARGETDGAVDELRRLLEADADDLEARAALVRLLLAEGRDARSESAALLEVLERRGLLRSQEKLE